MYRIVFACFLICAGSCWMLLADEAERRELPRGLPALSRSSDSPAQIELGKRLFSEKRMSADGSISCASCHDAKHHFATADAKAIGIRKQIGRRNAPSLMNRAFGKAFFWDGRAKTLEEQALQPIEDPTEMGHKVELVLKTLQDDSSYVSQFSKAFGSNDITRERLATALAAFQRSLLLGNSPVDAFVDGDTSKLSESAKQGLWLFESKAQCWKCHSGKNYTDEQFHNNGVSWGIKPIDLGRYEITKQENDKGKFKTPSLRGVSKTAPYFHDGSFKTLEEVVDFYSDGAKPNPYIDPIHKPLYLTDREKKDLVAFLKALSEEVKE